jgi:hypothetical protein
MPKEAGFLRRRSFLCGDADPREHCLGRSSTTVSTEVWRQVQDGPTWLHQLDPPSYSLKANWICAAGSGAF